jgi:hypothetical protein
LEFFGHCLNIYFKGWCKHSKRCFVFSKVSEPRSELSSQNVNFSCIFFCIERYRFNSLILKLESALCFVLTRAHFKENYYVIVGQQNSIRGPHVAHPCSTVVHLCVTCGSSSSTELGTNSTGFGAAPFSYGHFGTSLKAEFGVPIHKMFLHLPQFDSTVWTQGCKIGSFKAWIRKIKLREVALYWQFLAALNTRIYLKLLNVFRFSIDWN